MRTGASWAVVFALAIGSGAARAQSAGAPLVEVVVLHDGSTFQGELVEKVIGDHVTIKLATGALRTFAWADIESTQEPGAASGGTLPLTQDGSHIVTDWPEPDREAPAFTGAHLTLGVEGGYGAPEGYAGAFVGIEPTSWLEFEAGAGTGGAYGPAVAETVHAGFTILDLIRMGLGGGFSQNFTSSDYTKQGAPSISNWVNGELFFDLALGHHAFIRTSVGAAFMTNSSKFAVLCEGPAKPESCTDFSFTGGPITAGEDAAQGSLVWITYGSVRFAWMFDL